MTKEIVKSETNIQKPVASGLKGYFSRTDIKSRFEELLGKRSTAFITSILQMANSNDLLKKADPASIYSAALTAAVMDLPLNPNLGFAYIVPYNQKFQDDEGQWRSKQVAQFQMGYKGFIQLAQRSGQFKTISACEIYEGQLIQENPLTGFEFDFTKKDSDKVIGYAGYFELLNGFQKTLYIPIAEISAHAKRYSQTFKKDTGIWKDNFHAMATKTVIKLLLSKYAPLSVEMQRATISDQSVINNVETMDVTFIDNSEPMLIEPSPEAKEASEKIKNKLSENNVKIEEGKLL